MALEVTFSDLSSSRARQLFTILLYNFGYCYSLFIVHLIICTFDLFISIAYIDTRSGFCVLLPSRLHAAAAVEFFFYHAEHGNDDCWRCSEDFFRRLKIRSRNKLADWNFLPKVRYQTLFVYKSTEDILTMNSRRLIRFVCNK